MTPWLYVIAIAIGELVTSFVNPQLGILIHGIIFISLLVHSLLNIQHTIHQLYLSLSLAPLIRIISLSMPLYSFPRIYWYILTGIPLLVAVIVIMRILRYKLKEIGITIHGIFLQILIGITGLGMGYIEYFILHPEPLIEHLTFNSLWLPSLILLFFTGFIEELIFRGVMQKSAQESLGKWGILLISTVFAVLHIGHLSLLDVIFVFGIGLLFSWIVRKTQSIIGVSLAHGITNIALYLIWPLIL